MIKKIVWLLGLPNLIFHYVFPAPGVFGLFWGVTEKMLLQKLLYFAWSISLNRKKIWLIICLKMFIKNVV